MAPHEFAEAHPKEWIIRRGAIERVMLEANRRKMRTWNGDLKRKNIWMWGKPGVGKSRWAHEHPVNGETLVKMCNKWWEGMDPRLVSKVIIEDFPAQQADIHAHHLKVWLDRYVFIGESKGSSLMISPGRFFVMITANFHPKECFTRQQDLEAIMRRMTVMEMTAKNAPLLRRIRLDQTILQSSNEDEEDELDLEPISLEEATEALKCELFGDEDEEW
jgi:hypothetical protein